MSLFIAFEGPDGSGKSTQAHNLAFALRRAGSSVIETREPGGTPLGDSLRELLLSPESPSASPLAMTFLLSAARCQHVSDVIRPALESGDAVITDRYAASTLAYQGYGFGVDLAIIRNINEVAVGGLWPDITICVDVTPEVGLRRIASRVRLDRIDSETQDFHRRVRDAYLRLAHDNRDSWYLINGDDTPDAVERAIMEKIKPALSGVADFL